MRDGHELDRGALWHYRQAVSYADRANGLGGDPGRHLREMALIHATLFAGLAQALVDGPHGAARASLIDLASLPDGDH